MLEVGRWRVHFIDDGPWRIDGGSVFGIVPKVFWERWYTADPRNRIELHCRSLLAEDGRTRILIEAGFGDKLDAKERDIYDRHEPSGLVPALAALGVEPGEIDRVILTHLHRDHAGGGTRLFGDSIQPTFPNARYTVQRGEWESATHPTALDRASYLASHLDPVADAGLVDRVDGDREIAPGVRVELTGGHTPHHSIVWIEDGGRSLVYAGDLVPTAAHLAPAAITAYDLDRPTTLARKTSLVAEVARRGTVVAWSHDARAAASRLVESGGAVEAVPVETDETES